MLRSITVAPLSQHGHVVTCKFIVIMAQSQIHEENVMVPDFLTDLQHCILPTKAYLEGNGAKKALVPDTEKVPVDEPEPEEAVTVEEQSKVEEGEPMLEDVAEDNESLHSELQLAYNGMDEDEEESEAAVADMAEQEEEAEEEEEDHTTEEAEEQNDLGDPAVMKAVRGQPTLEVRWENQGLFKRL